ncbi:hypothetical protein [Brumimicrobium oceani]|uniref:DUF5723 domain-containing protein n=1 Tax=Brumimicrobium oceani TaxID=2100725 RepID=A0A2U2XDR5_9FLAO|nr:hypothetical protein [Brumimicrobium oceani]PWH85935.1 hypothetical protein DIT68_07540 [Brumimicrobium oceani]PWH85959.1 hypothetical protein DIT68_07675 [Brumimicrobium oceani]
MFRSLLVALFIVISGNALVQINTNSPYSARGLGDVGFYGNAYISALGGAATALTDSSQTNLFNPSTYSLTAKQLPLFSMGLTHFEKRFSNNGMESEGRFSGITHMALVIPFGNRFGVAAGLKPLSRRGYEINDHEVIAGDSIFYDYTGDGDLQEVMIGFSGNILDRKKQSLSVGVNGKYYFGKLNNQRRTYTVSNSVESGGMDIQSIRAKDFGVEFGLNYDFRPNLTHSFRVAGVFRPGKELSFEKSQTRIHYSNFFEQGLYDTIIKTGDISGNVFLPTKTSLGLTYTFTPQNDSTSKSSKLPSLMVTMEYSMEEWSSYNEDFNNSVQSGQYVNSNSFRVGVEFMRHRQAFDRSAYISIFDRLKYRIGAYSVNTPYEVNGEQLMDQGFTAGIGFPIVMNRAVSTVNISGTYGEMGRNSGPAVLKESYFGFNFGINIAPGYDRWFRKYKLD